VREDNPARDVQGPDRGIERSGPYLFPVEFLAIMHCARVPTRWKRLVAFAVCTYARRGELEALEWSDVQLDRGYIHIHRAVDSKGEIKPTKTGDTRKVPIEPTLLPLLERMHDDAAGEGRVFTSMPPAEEMAKRLRRYVAWACEDAGIELREELLADDETRRPLVWHDLRHTGITWRAVRGDDPLKVQRAAGHTDLRTTQRYINEAQTFEDRGTFGEPFPPLPSTVLSTFVSTTEALLPQPVRNSTGIMSVPKGIRKRTERRDAATPAVSRGSDPAPVERVSESQRPNDAKPRDVDAGVDTVDAIEAALATALAAASSAGQWTVVGVLAKELESRRLTRSGPSPNVGPTQEKTPEELRKVLRILR
jgi:hypothetical protein